MAGRTKLIAWTLIATLWAVPVLGEDDFLRDLGWGTLAVVSNVFYVPAKLAWAGVGGITGSLAYVVTLGDVDTAKRIWQPTLGGNYIVTPAMLRGEEPLYFSPTEEEQPLRRRRTRRS
ncbi:MAG: hypothetical protein KatS3mg077_3373 [Candidatus Binatia bacterium]|nr:MAG: hypothetical protein KatS3mg077_3373 [Candidatus Binatia bacterium]